MIRFKTPRFWSHKGIVSTLLLPLSWLYGLGHALHQTFVRPYQSSLPVLCVGNAVAGGGGKTPAVAALVGLLLREKLAARPYILMRGYGAEVKAPTLVDPARHTYRDVGDEALLACRHAPVIVGADRAAGARLAERLGADVLIMDDGLQNPGLTKDIVVLAVDKNMGFGNGRLLPAGPLRAPLSRTLARADFILLIGEGEQADFLPLSLLKKDVRILNALVAPVNATLPQGALVAFAGIAYPEKFKRTLLECGATLSEWVAFADHYPYTSADMEKLEAIANARNARLITTEKDHVRLPSPYKEKILCLPIEMKIEDAPSLTAALKTMMGRA